MAVTAALVKALRDRTGAGMMECKKALVETDGDIEAAVEHLRKTGLAKADKKAGRTASEGRVLLRCDGQRGVLVEVNSETDFVAKDENFSAYAESVAEAACKLASDNVSRVLEHADASGTSLEQARQALVAKLGENIQVRRIALTEAGGTLGSYLHGGRIGVLVEVEGGDEALAKDIAMHIAASKPAYISEQDVPTAVVDKEKEIFAAQARESGKPEEIIDKMVVGRLRKYLAEITLLGQAFVKNPDQSVAQLLKEKDAKVTAFQRLEVGEGIEKKDENFAEEVMAQVRDS